MNKNPAKEAIILKKYIVDASVFLFAPYALGAFDDNEVIIAKSTLRQIAETAHKGTGESRANAIEFSRLLDSLFDSPGASVSIENGGLLVIAGHGTEDIYTIAASENATIVTRDPIMRVMAKSLDIPSEAFRSEQLVSNAHPYEGRCNLYVSANEMQTFAQEKSLYLSSDNSYIATDSDGETISENYRLTPNEYVTLINAESPNGGTMLGRFDGTRIVPLLYKKDHPVYGVTARNAGQMFALDALMNPDAPLVILRGPAGTAKTFLSMAAGLEQTINTNVYKRILVTRPNTKMDNDVGFLKGDEVEKVLPSLRGLLDNIDDLMGGSRGKEMKDDSPLGSYLDDLMERGVIEAQAMAYMRGRSIKYQYMVVDEMQNSTATQALSIITRIGDFSKIVLLGDPAQIDSPYLDSKSNGLTYAAERMKGSPLCWQVTFSQKETTRSALAKEAIERMSPKNRLFTLE